MLSDVRTLHMNGIELLTKIKDLGPEVNAIFFMIAFDADYVKSDLDKYKYKVAEIFQKPLLMKDLIKKLLIGA